MYLPAPERATAQTGAIDTPAGDQTRRGSVRGEDPGVITADVIGAVF